MNVYKEYLGVSKWCPACLPCLQRKITANFKREGVSVRTYLGHPVQRRNKRPILARAQPRLFEEEMDQNMIQNMYKYYTKRLHDCKRRNGQMAKY